MIVIILSRKPILDLGRPAMIQGRLPNYQGKPIFDLGSLTMMQGTHSNYQGKQTNYQGSQFSTSERIPTSTDNVPTIKEKVYEAQINNFAPIFFIMLCIQVPNSVRNPIMDVSLKSFTAIRLKMFFMVFKHKTGVLQTIK